MYKVAGTLIFFPSRRGTLISFHNPNLAPRPLNIGKSYLSIAYLGSLKLILLDSIKRAIKNSKKGSDLIYFPNFKLNLASGPLNIVEFNFFIAFLNSLNLIILDSIKKNPKKD